MRVAGVLVKLVAAGEDVVLATAVALLGCHVANGTMAMLVVVPGDEAGDQRPTPCGKPVD